MIAPQTPHKPAVSERLSAETSPHFAKLFFRVATVFTHRLIRFAPPRWPCFLYIARDPVSLYLTSSGMVSNSLELLSPHNLPFSTGYPRPRSILGGLGGAGIGISAETVAPETATSFVRWITSKSVQSGPYLVNNGQSANRQTWLNQGRNPEVAPLFRGGFHTIDNAWTRPRDPWFQGFVDDACTVSPDFFGKNIPSDVFLADFDAIFLSPQK